MNETGEYGIVAYDLEPPAAGSPHPAPMRDQIRNPQARPRWEPPPLPGGHVRVELEDDYYAGAYFSDWTGPEAEYPTRVFDVPREQYDRWTAARDAYCAMQEEIEAVREERNRSLGMPGWPQRAGWVRKDKPYQVQP